MKSESPPRQAISDDAGFLGAQPRVRAELMHPDLCAEFTVRICCTVSLDFTHQVYRLVQHMGSQSFFLLVKARLDISCSEPHNEL